MRLPFPAHTLSPVPVAPELLPRPCKAEGVFAPNTALRAAVRLFEGQVIGSGERGGGDGSRAVEERLLSGYGKVAAVGSQRGCTASHGLIK